MSRIDEPSRPGPPPDAGTEPDSRTEPGTGIPPDVEVVRESPEAALRHGVLTLNDVIAQSVTVIAPGLSAGLISYLAATKAGGATPLAFLIALLGTLCIGGVVSEFGRTLPSAGSIYTYTTTGLSRLAGFVVGWLYSITFVILGGGALAGFAYFLSALIQSLTLNEATGEMVTVPWYWFFLGGIVFLAVMSLFDIRISTRSQLVFTALSVAIFLVAAFIVIGRGSPADSVNPDKIIDLGAFWPSAAGVPWTGILFGFAFGILSFTGFETGAVLAEETANPKHNIPRAVIGSVLVAGVFYVITTYATSLGFGVREAAEAWPGAAAGLVAVTPYAWLGNVVLFAIVVSCLFAALGVHTVVSRTLFAMGRERVMPGALGTTHPRHKTPWVAIFVDLVLWLVLVFGMLLLFSDETEMAAAALPPGTEDPNVGGLAAFAFLLTLGTPLVMFAYLMLGLAGVGEGRKVRNRRLVVLGVLSAITGAVAVFGSIYYSFVQDAIFVIRLVPWLALAVVVVGLAVGMWQRTRRPEHWREMGRIFEEA